MKYLNLDDIERKDDYLIIKNKGIDIVFSTAEEGKNFNRNTEEGQKNINSLKYWNVGSGIDFSCMFANCKSLIDISALRNWNVSNGEDFSDMFKNCSNVKEIEWQND